MWFGISSSASRNTRSTTAGTLMLTRSGQLLILQMKQIGENYILPRTLRRPGPPPKLVYLDLNHWIALAKTLSGHHDGKKDTALLDFCLRAVEREIAIFPISLSIYIEIFKIKDYRRRCDFRKAIELLSRYNVVTPRFVVATHEIEALLDHIVGPNPEPINTMDYLDWGVFRAFGLDGSIRVESAEGRDVTNQVRQSFLHGPQVFDEILLEGILKLNRQVIDGPSPEEDAEFREQGYDPIRVLEQFEKEAANEVEFAHRLNDDPKWRRGRLRDVVSAREVLMQINSILRRGCDERGVVSLESLQSPFPSVTDARRAFNSMPSFDASVTLKTSLHKNARHRWTPNDVHDVHALASTLPYCDIVITDRAMASQAAQTGLASRLNTIVLSHLSDLRQHL